MGDSDSAPLRELEVLLVDCQTTGATPARGSVLELAWCRTRATDATRDLAPRATLVALPGAATLPRRIANLTGIRPEELADAPAADAVWARLIGAASDGTTLPCVAHYARFERMFLTAMHADHGDDEAPFPLDFVCTHEIATRLLPDLPRRGLRAVAGYLGHVVPEDKRAATHVHATAAVWTGLVEMLAADHGVTSLADLRQWLTEVKPQRRTGRGYLVPRAERLALPETPGVYRFLGPGGEILYVGKATSLRRRVNSYFQKRRHAAERTLELLSQARSIDPTETITALEAALLETDEIKRHAPPYNVALRGREARLWYARHDLTELSETRSSGYPRGPFPRRDAVAAVGRLSEVIGGDDETAAAALASGMLGVPLDAEIDPAVLIEGLALFAERNEVVAPVSARRLLGVGARIWRRVQEERAARAAQEAAEEEPGEEPEKAPNEPEKRDWAIRTADEVRAALEWIVSDAAHLHRRARWMRQLAGARIVWRSASLPGDLIRVLDLTEGAVIHRETTESPPPPRAEEGRSGAFDPATYDRLRVLLTELRRLVGAGSEPELHLGSDVRLTSDSLRRRLFWV